MSSTGPVGGRPAAAHTEFIEPELQLLALQVNTQSANDAGAHADIEKASKDIERARKQLEEARERAREANEKSGFFADMSDLLGDDVATAAAVAGAAAAIVASGGAATPLVIAAAGLTLSAKVAESQGVDPKICAAIGLSGAVLGACAGGPGGVSTFVAIAHGVEGGAHVGAGVSDYQAAREKHEAEEAKADGAWADLAGERANDRHEDAIQEIGKSARQTAKSTSLVMDIQAARHASQQAVLSKIGGV